MTSRHIVMHGRSRSDLSGLDLLDNRLLYILLTLKTFSKTIEIESGVWFVDAKTKDIAKVL